jgi:hypothetical protein
MQHKIDARFYVQPNKVVSTTSHFHITAIFGR